MIWLSVSIASIITILIVIPKKEKLTSKKF